jgi:hypothetical protein
MGDWICDNLGWILGAFILFCLVGLFGAGMQITKARSAFMAECVQYQKQYECTAMWRAGEQHHSTTVVPMPIVTRCE